MCRIVRNKKLDNGDIEETYYCNLQYACKGNPSLNLIYIGLEGIIIVLMILLFVNPV